MRRNDLEVHRGKLMSNGPDFSRRKIESHAIAMMQETGEKVGVEIRQYLLDDGSLWESHLEHNDATLTCEWHLVVPPAPRVVVPAEAETVRSLRQQINHLVEERDRLRKAYEDLKKDQTVASPDRPKTMTVDELRVGDEIQFDGIALKYRGQFNIVELSFIRDGEHRTSPKKSISEVLARGVQVYRDGKLVSGWPVGEAACVQEVDKYQKHRIDELEEKLKSESLRAALAEGMLSSAKDEIEAWKKAANSSDTGLPIAHVQNPGMLIERIDKLEQKVFTQGVDLACAKSPKLDAFRVLATTVKIMQQVVDGKASIGAYPEEKFNAECVVSFIHRYNKGPISSKPYDYGF